MSYPLYLNSNSQPYIDVDDERLRSIAKHGNHAQDNLSVDNPNLLYNVGEEFGEVIHCLTYDGPKSELRKELVQLAAMTIAWIEVLDKRESDSALSNPITLESDDSPTRI